MRKEQLYLVVMVAVKQTDGLFKGPRAVRRFVGGKPGDIQSVWITGNEIVIIDFVSKHQRDKALNINVLRDNNCDSRSAWITSKEGSGTWRATVSHF